MNPITLLINELKPALVGLGKILSKRTTLPVLSYVRVERSANGRVDLCATDLDSAVIARLDTPSQGEPITLLIAYEELHNITKGCRASDTLILAPTSKQRVALKFPVGGQIIEHCCDSLPAEQFPPIAEIRGEPVILNESLRRSIHEALQCASIDETRLILNGAYLDVSKPQAHYVVGTDGRHLYSSNSFALSLKDSLVIPNHRFVEWKEFHSDGDWALRVAKPGKDEALQFELASTHWRFISRSFEGNYPNWRQVVPDGGGTLTTVEIEPSAVDCLIQTIARLPNHDTVNFGIGLEIANSRLYFLARSASGETWSRIEVADVKIRGRGVTIHLNRQLLTKALRFGLTRLDVIDAMSPLRFSHDGRQMIIMPTRPDAAPAQPRTPQPTPSASVVTSQTNPPPRAEQPETKPMPENSTNGGTARAASTTTTTSEKPALETALAHVEVVRGDFRNAIAGLNKLADSLKQAQREQKTSEKEIQSVRQTLRSLQSVRI